MPFCPLTYSTTVLVNGETLKKEDLKSQCKTRRGLVVKLIENSILVRLDFIVAIYSAP